MSQEAGERAYGAFIESAREFLPAGAPPWAWADLPEPMRIAWKAAAEAARNECPAT
jgi:hypothetical protein